jgi:hypothetical protein
MITAAITCVRVVGAVFCVVLAAVYAAIPLLVPGTQQLPTAVILAAAVMAVWLAYALWPWRRRNSVRLARGITPTLSEDPNENRHGTAPVLRAGSLR